MNERFNSLMFNAAEKEIARLDKKIRDLENELLVVQAQTASACITIFKNLGVEKGITKVKRAFQLDAGKQQELF